MTPRLTGWTTCCVETGVTAGCASGVGDGLGVSVGGGVGVEVEVGDGVLVGVAVGVSVGIGVNVGVDVLVGKGVGVEVAVDVDTGVNVGVGVSVGSGEGVSVAVGAGDGGVSDSSGAVKTKGVNCRSGGLSGSFPGDQQPAAPADSSTETLHHTICTRYRLNAALWDCVHFPFSKLPRPAT